MDRTDNILRILVTVLSILFLLIAIKTSYPAESTGDMTINIAGKFIICELILFSAIYVGGPMLSDAMPALWHYYPKVKQKFTTKIHRKSLTLHVSNVEDSLEDIGHEEEDQSGSEVRGTDKSRKITVLNEEIITYVTKTFENILTPEYIEKLLNNFRNLNNGGPYEVIEKIAFPVGITQYDLWNFTWNILARIYNKKISREKMRDAGATLAKTSFPLTVTSDHQTVSRRMRYFDDPANYSLHIIEVNCKLVPHQFPIKIEVMEENIEIEKLSELEK